jgi:hypothetical protein
MSEGLDQQDERSAFRRRGFIAASGFITLVVIAGIAVIAEHGSGGHPAAAATTAAVAGATPDATAPAAAGCAPSDTDQSIPATTPDVTWTLWTGEALPTSSADGPAQVTGAVPDCYADTPTGALVALTQMELRMQVAQDPDMAAITAADFVPNTGEKAAETLYASGAQVSDYTASFQTAGYEFVSYTKSAATIQLAMTQSDGGYESAAFTVQYNAAANNWQGVLSSNGAFGTALSGINGLTGYVPWSGVS